MAVLHAGSLTLGGIVLGESDASGVEWFLESLEGWSDAAPSTGSAEQRGSAHGGFLSPAYYTPRVIVVGGALLAADWAAASVALDRLMAAIPLDVPKPMLVNEGTRTLQADVRQEGDPLVERQDGFARFSLSLIAADPRRYSAVATTSTTGLAATTGGLSLPVVLPVSLAATASAGTLSATNAGNMESLPVFTVAGPCPPFTIADGAGRQLSFAESVPAGRTLVIDTANRTALLDGVASRVVTGTWLRLDPGVNQFSFKASGFDAAARLTINFRSAWR